MILATEMQTKMEHATLLKSVFKKVVQMKEVAHRATVYVAHVSLDTTVVGSSTIFFKDVSFNVSFYVK